MRSARNSLLAVSAIVLGALCATPSAAGPAGDKAKAAAPATSLTVQAVVDGSWRTPQDRARDGARHPIESFTFWGLKPNMTVAEIRPGAGYWTDLLAPYLAAGGGKLIVTSGDPDKMTDAQKAGRDRYLKRYQDNPALFGTLEVGVFAANSDKLLAAPNSVDLIISSRNFHGFVLQNIKDYALKSMFNALKPGGLVAIEQHRGDARRPQNAASGYIRQDWVIAQMRQAGFEFVAASELNANPKDTKDHPFGVWTLPPTLQTAPSGQPANPDFDNAKYKAIGESDRMTLLFRKPAK
ncbi:COG4798 Predicted methyltransferase [Caulobacteraceae bacterium]|jgi:predicted methyltransferase|eukprot:gene8785-11867_t